MELLDLDVGPVAHGGWCIARHDGRVVFVRHALPGERIRAQVVEETKRFLRADATEILAPSPDRVEPPCPYAGPGRCGGCDWQHATPEAQRRLKAAVVEEQLRRLAKIEHAVEVEALPSPTGRDDGLGWRTRTQFAVAPDGTIGFHRHRSHDVHPVDRCLITHAQIEQLHIERRRWPGIDRVEAAASAATGDRVIRVEGKGRRQHVPRLDAPVRVVRGRPVAGPALPYVREEAAGRTWRVSATGFWQVHPAAADVLVEAVLEALQPRESDSALDLFCGVGLFAGAVAGRLGNGSVVGIEADPVAVRDARHNLRDLPNVRIERGRVDQTLDRIALVEADLVVLDPPRAGAGHEVVYRIASLAPRTVAYVSCDPATLARDLGWFAELGYRLDGLRAFDTFPMTHHVECVAKLVR
ncbi:MAG TPA: class I SAM-dependent RNA methyltransferase [Actinopolymorphaceae bacterium]